MDSPRTRISNEALALIKEEAERTGMNQVDVLDKLLGIDRIVSKNPSQRPRKQTKTPDRPCPAVVDSLILSEWFFDPTDKDGTYKQKLSRRDIIKDVRARMHEPSKLNPKYLKNSSWSDIFPEFMKDASKQKSTFVKYIENRLESLRTRGIIHRIKQEDRIVHYVLSVANNEVRISHTEWYAIVAATLVPVSKDLFIPEFLDKR